MILPRGKYRVYLATRPMDFRKGHAGLVLVVQQVLGLDPYCGAVFVFRSKRGDRVKILVWDQTGLVFAIGLERMATRWLTLQALGGWVVSLAKAGRWDDHTIARTVLGTVRGVGLEGSAG